MMRSLDRGAYMIMALAVVAVILAIVLPLCVFNGDGDGDEQVIATATQDTTPDDADGTPTPPQATATQGETATPTQEAFDDPDDALIAFVRDEFDAEFIGECPLAAPPAGEGNQICGSELYRSEELVTFTLGVPLSEGIGEAVITIDDAGLWSVAFVPLPPPGGAEIAVGETAVVFGAGSCLNFREEPSTGSEIVFCLIDGTSETVVDGPVTADGATWWRLEGFGWASDEFLIPLVN